MKIDFGKTAIPGAGALVVGVAAERRLSATAKAVDRASGRRLTRAAAAGRFSGKRDEILDMPAPAGLALSRVVLVGLGDVSKVDALAVQRLGGAIAAHLDHVGEKTAAVAIDAMPGATLGTAAIAANLAYGARLRRYRFAKYRTKEKNNDQPTLAALTLMLDDPKRAEQAYRPLAAVAEGVFLTRDLVSEPANVLYPATLAERARALLRLGVKVEVLGERRLEALGMGALLGVGQGSERESQVVVMRWNGGPARAKPVALVGKGVTFDTGGISIKPSAGMEDMKWDMGGAGAVIGAMRALAGRKARVNVVGMIGLVENMPSGTAQRPGDVVTSMSGQTIEVINTDAEGRLVLADVLWYCQTRFKPRAMVDLATLTGAIVVALGHYQAGLFSNDDALADQLVAAGKAVGERLWRMPLGEDYDKDINSDIADMKNVGAGREAGSTAGAQFLQRFVGDTPWAHLDIAGMAWSKKGDAVTPKGGTGYGVRLLERWVADNFEGK
ncbi:MAG: leucyl aminopeptidase [Alphaproteobacteria bacterium]|nr:leucyl aminopeptidase [Alphaproteobacteria bacterium]